MDAEKLNSLYAEEVLRVTPNGIDIENILNPITFETYNDHRMAMAFAPLVAVIDTVTIENPEVVVKSYPEFWEEFS